MKRRVILVTLVAVVGLAALLVAVWAVERKGYVLSPATAWRRQMLLLEAWRDRRYAEKQVRLRPDDARVRKRLAEAYLREGRQEAAMETVRTAVALSPKSAEIWHSYGFCALRIAKHTPGSEEREKALAEVRVAGERMLSLCKEEDITRKPALYIEAAFFLAEGGNLGEARDAYGLAIVTAQKLADSEDLGMRGVGETFLEEVVAKDVWGLATRLKAAE